MSVQNRDEKVYTAIRVFDTLQGPQAGQGRRSIIGTGKVPRRRESNESEKSGLVRRRHRDRVPERTRGCERTGFALRTWQPFGGACGGACLKTLDPSQRRIAAPKPSLNLI